MYGVYCVYVESDLYLILLLLSCFMRYHFILDLIIAVSSLTYESPITSWHLPLPWAGWDSEVRSETTMKLCFIIIIKSEVWTHCLGLGHETMVSTVCLSKFLWPQFRFQFLLQIRVFICHYWTMVKRALLVIMTKPIIQISPWTHSDRDKMAAIYHAFSWMKMLWFRLKFLWNLFPRVQLRIFQYWF